MSRLKQIWRALFDHFLRTLCVIYVCILFLCVYFWTAASDAKYLAARDLAPNHRIAPSDLERPAAFAASAGFYMEPSARLEGKYLKRSIKRGEQVSAAVVSNTPSMQLPDSLRAVAFPLQADSIPIELLDAGSPATLLGQDPAKGAIAVPATVHAIFCEQKSGSAQSCRPILSVPADKIVVVENNLKTMHLLLSSPPKP